jgi:nitroimidazol reductase NimA-like FMN-containing flavoprotein (pyridoxamine 5'-phosphate oxidase superfamily)
MPHAAYVVEDLDRAECERLIQTVRVGRIGSIDRGLPKIVPVH